MTAPIDPRSAQLFSDILYRNRIEPSDYDALGARWTRLLSTMQAASGVKLIETFMAALASWPDGEEIERLVFECAPGDPVPDSDDGGDR